MAIQRSELSKALGELTKKIEKENKASILAKSNEDLRSQIEKLEEDSNDNSKELQRLFQMAIEKINNPDSSRQALTAAETQLETIKKTAETEEQRRERNKAQEEANDRLEQIAKGIDGMANSFESFADKLKPSSGFLAGLAGLALLLLDPEEIQKILLNALNFIEDMINTIKMIIEGDIGGALELMKENLTSLGALFGVAVLFFGGKIIRAAAKLVRFTSSFYKMILLTGSTIGKFLSSFSKAFKITKLSKAFSSIGNGFKNFTDGIMKIGAKVKTFFQPVTKVFSSIGKWFSSIGQTFSKLLNLFKTTATSPSMLSKVTGIFGKILAKVALPLTIIMGIWESIKGAMAGFSEGGIIGGIKGAITGLFNGLIGGLLDLIKDGVSWLLEKLGFENASEFLDSFSFSDLYKSFVDTVFSLGENAFNWLKDKFMGAWDFISALFSTGEEGGESFSIGGMIMDTIDNIKQLFIDLFDFLPSFDDIKNSIKSILPSWLGGTADSVSQNVVTEEQSPARIARKRTRRETISSSFNINENQSQLSSSSSMYNTSYNTNGASEYSNVSFLLRAIGKSEVYIISDKKDISTTINTMPIPSGIMEGTNTILEQSATAPIIVVGGGNRGSSSNTNVNNVSSVNNVISNGVTADDFVRRDFVNSF